MLPGNKNLYPKIAGQQKKERKKKPKMRDAIKEMIVVTATPASADCRLSESFLYTDSDETRPEDKENVL